MPFVNPNPYAPQMYGQMGTPGAYGMDFPPPYETPKQTKSAAPSVNAQGETPYHDINSPAFLGGDSHQDSGGGMDMGAMLQIAGQQAQMDKAMADYQANVKMARFMLPQTLKQIGSQYGAQGNYYSSGRRRTQQEAIYKTSFDLQAAKRDMQLQQQMLQLEMMKQMMGRSGGG